MSYIGRGLDKISNVEKLDNITFDGSATYALTKSSAAFTPVGANNILISIDGVIQQGNFSVSTTNIVFDWSPTSSNTCNFILHYGTGVLNVPADGSVSLAKMAANSVDSNQYVDGSIDAVHMSANSIDSDAYVDASIDTAHIGALQVTGAKLNTDVISAQTALAVAPADTDEFMVSDAGVLKRIDYSLIKGGGTWVQLHDAESAVDVASVSVDDVFASGSYDAYKIIIHYFAASAHNNEFRFVFRDGGSDLTATSYIYAGDAKRHGGTDSISSGSDSAYGVLTEDVQANDTNTNGVAAEFNVMTTGSNDGAAAYPRIYGHGTYHPYDETGSLVSFHSASMYKVATEPDGIKFYWGTGNIISYRWTIYGIKVT
jgi:hypothetical protein